MTEDQRKLWRYCAIGVTVFEILDLYFYTGHALSGREAALAALSGLLTHLLVAGSGLWFGKRAAVRTPERRLIPCCDAPASQPAPVPKSRRC